MMSKIGSKKDKVIEHQVNYAEQDTSLPPAIIVDIDGTIALINKRSPFDQTKWHQDLPHQPIIDLIYAVTMGYWGNTKQEITIIFMTGREGGEENQNATWDWIYEYAPLLTVGSGLYMRKQGDQRGDVIVKKEMFDEHVKDKYNVLWVFEDRNKMINFWRNEMHLPTLQVKDGDY